MSGTAKFSETVNLEGCPEMDKALAIQVGEAMLLQAILKDENGLRTLFRVNLQSKSTNDRVKSFYRLVEPIWQALKQPNGYSLIREERIAWETNLKNATVTSIFTVMGDVGIDEIEVQNTNTGLNGTLDKIQRAMNWLKDINLAEATDVIFNKYEGDAINIDNVDDAAVCKEAIRAYDFIQPYMLDFGQKSKKYVVNCNATKVWSKERGISVAKEEFLPNSLDKFHPRIVRQNATVFMQDWWNELINSDTRTACTYSAKLCHQPFKAMLIIQSKIIDIRDRRSRKTWNRLTRGVQAEFTSNPAIPENAISSWNMGLSNADYRR